MYAIHHDPRPAQRAICLIVAAFIVASGLTLGVIGAQAAERNAIAVVTAQA